MSEPFEAQDKLKLRPPRNGRQGKSRFLARQSGGQTVGAGSGQE
jgi:hypothetical protein